MYIHKNGESLHIARHVEDRTGTGSAAAVCALLFVAVFYNGAAEVMFKCGVLQMHSCGAVGKSPESWNFFLGIGAAALIYLVCSGVRTW